MLWGVGPGAVVAAYVIGIAISFALTVGLSIVGYRNRKTPGGELFAATMGLCSLWALSALLTVIADTDWLLIAAEVLQNGCAITTPVAWFGFVVTYVGYERMLGGRELAALFVAPTVGLLAMALWPVTDLYFANVALGRVAGGVSIVRTPDGPLARLLLAYLLGLVAVGLALIGQLLLEENNLFSRQAVWLLAGSLAPLAAALLEPVGLLSNFRLPHIPFGFAVMGVAYSYGLFSHRAFALSPGVRRIGADRVLEAVSESVIILDSDGTVLGCNRSAIDRFDWESEAAVLGRPIDTLAPDLAGVTQASAREFDHDGTRLEVSTSPITDSRDRGIGTALVVRDVTARYERRQRLSVLNRVLRHNVRNSVTVIRGRATELCDRYGDTHARTIVSEAEDLLDTAETARAIDARLERDELLVESIDLAHVVDAVVDDVRPSTGDTPIDTQVPPSATVRTDRSLLWSVLKALVENAVVHGNSATTEDRAAVRISAADEPDGVRIEVRDDGPGIPDTELAAIRRGTETPVEHGTGMGLWVATWGASQLGGSVTFETDDGTIARLFVPDRSRT